MSKKNPRSTLTFTGTFRAVARDLVDNPNGTKKLHELLGVDEGDQEALDAEVAKLLKDAEVVSWSVEKEIDRGT
jgi:hypothetical protein